MLTCLMFSKLWVRTEVRKRPGRFPGAAFPAGTASVTGPGPATPDLVQRQMAFLSINSLIKPMARVGLRPLGQASTQFMMVWQRNSL